MKNIALLCNPMPESAGKVLPMADRISYHLSQKDVRFSIINSQWPAVFNDFTEIWIVGGDGTLNYFLNHYTDNELPLVVFPGGSGNDYHWALYGKIEVEEQAGKKLYQAPFPYPSYHV